jgi:hypothetical protein
MSLSTYNCSERVNHQTDNQIDRVHLLGIYTMEQTIYYNSQAPADTVSRCKLNIRPTGLTSL